MRDKAADDVMVVAAPTPVLVVPFVNVNSAGCEASAGKNATPELLLARPQSESALCNCDSSVPLMLPVE